MCSDTALTCDHAPQEEVAEGSIRGSTHITSYQFMDDRYSVRGVPITSLPLPSAVRLLSMLSVAFLCCP